MRPAPSLPPVSPQSVEVFFDGECPLCRREIDLIRWLDHRGRVRLTDIAAADFDAQRYGKTMDELMAEIHGRDAAGDWILGVEVFRQVYAAVGLGALVPMTRLPGVRQALDAAYRFFARRRLWLTGRCANGACRPAKSPPVAPRPGSGA